MSRIDLRSVRRIAGILCGTAVVLVAGTALAAEDFYKGKQITILVSGGGTYDAYARLMAKYMPKYIPGEPNFVVKNMSGASGLRAANHIFNNSPKDGTEIAGTHGHIPTIPIFTSQGIQYDPAKLSWIGSATREVYIGYAWNTSPVKSMDEARVKESIFGGQAVGSMSIDIPILANAMMGTKIKIVTGYSGSAEARLAMERGEIHGVFGTAWTTLTSSQPEWLKEKKITVIAQFGKTRYKEMPDVPLLLDYVNDPEDRKALEVFLSRQETGKPYFAPPGIPADRLAILRRAFDASVKDPELREEAAKAELDVIDPMTGEEIAAFVAEMSKTPPSYAKRIEDIFAKFSEKK